MKRLLLPFLFFGFFGMAFSQMNWSHIDPSEVPAKVLDEVEKLHPNKKHISWGMRYKGKKKIYHASGFDEGHYFSVKLFEDGTIYGKVMHIENHQVGDKVKSVIESYENKSWELLKIYHFLHHSKEEYRIFMKHTTDGNHLKLTLDKDGKVLKEHKRKKSHHQKHIIY